MKELLRIGLVGAAAGRGISLNAEIVGRLERSLWEDEQWFEKVCGKDVYALVTLVIEAARIIMGTPDSGHYRPYTEDVERSIELRAAVRVIFDEIAPAFAPATLEAMHREHGEEVGMIVLSGPAAWDFFRDPETAKDSEAALDPGETELTRQPRTRLTGVLRGARIREMEKTGALARAFISSKKRA